MNNTTPDNYQRRNIERVNDQFMGDIKIACSKREVNPVAANNLRNNPKGCKKVAGGRSEAQTPGKRRRRIRTLKGCQTNSVTLAGSEFIDTRSGGIALCAQPLATLFQPFGLTEVYNEHS